MKIIPAIDIIDGQCVRLSEGDYSSKKVYHDHPLEMAKLFEDAGLEYLHVVDLDGAKSGHIVNYKILESICSKTTLKVDFGGGLRSDQDVKIAFESGACQITGGSIAVSASEMFLGWLYKYGADRVILGADCKEQKIAINGWLEQSESDVVDFIKIYEQKGVQQVICTDISKDGMLAGASETLYQEIIKETGVQLIASGGVSSVKDIKSLKQLGCEGVIVGKAIYEGCIRLEELVNFSH